MGSRRAALCLVVVLVGLILVTGHGVATSTDASTPPPPEHLVDDYPPLVSGQTYCADQAVHFRVDANTTATAPFHLEPITDNGTESDLRTLTRANETRVVRLPDSAGRYALVGASGIPLSVNETGYAVPGENRSAAAFRVRNCSFDASLSAENVDVERLDRVFSVRVRANATERVSITLSDTSPEVFAAMVNGTVTADEVSVQVPPDGRIPVDSTGAFVCGPGTGEYVLRVQSLATGAVETLRFGATRTDDVDVGFTQSIVRVTRGSSAEVVVSGDPEEAFCYSEESLRLQVQSENGSFRVRSHMRDRDGDNVYRIRLDTGSRTASNGAQFLSGANNTTVVNPTLRSQPTTLPLPAGDYEMSLSADGDELAIGLLVVTERETPRDTATTTADAMETTISSDGPTIATTSTALRSVTTTHEDGPGLGLGIGLTGLVIAIAALARY